MLFKQMKSDLLQELNSKLSEVLKSQSHQVPHHQPPYQQLYPQPSIRMQLIQSQPQQSQWPTPEWPVNDLPVPNVRNVLSYFSVFNVQGLVPQTKPSKVPYISDLLHSNNQLFINLTETWVGNHKEAELQIDGYVLFNSERNHKGRSTKGCLSGGVATYVRTDYSTSFKPLLNYSNGVAEALCLYSALHNLVIINIYRQPDNPLHRSTNKHFGEVLLMISNILELLSAPTPTIIMTGDFNLPHADWKNLRCLTR